MTACDLAVQSNQIIVYVRVAVGIVAEFAKEARRRRVFRVMAVYIVGLWVLLQVADVLFPAVGIEESRKLYILLGGLICFPAALVFGWRYDLTKDGIVRTPPVVVDPQKDLALAKADYLILAALLVVIVVVGMALSDGIYQPSPPGEIVDSTRSPPEKSLAVLPFRNLSDADDRYFAEGITEEIINTLVQIDDLKLVGRSSSFAFGSANADQPRSEDTVTVREVLSNLEAP